MSPFLFVARPVPFPDESLLGFVKRHAFLLDGGTPRRLMAAIGHSTDIRDLPRSANLHAMEGAYGPIGSQLLEKCFHPSDGKQVAYKGHKLHRYALNLWSPRVCPHCMGESAHYRQAWSFAFVNICPVHDVRLLDRCTTCNKRFSWSDKAVDACSGCKTHISRMKAPSAANGSSEATRFLISLLEEEKVNVPDILAGLPYSDVLEFLSILGRLDAQARGEAGYPGRTFSWPNADAVLASGFRIASGWPSAFVDVLDRLASKHSDHSSLQHVFGAPYRAIRKAPLAGWGGRLSPLFNSYVAELGRSYGGSERQRQNQEGKVRRRLGLTREAFRTLKRQAALCDGETPSIDTEARLEAKLNQAVNTKTMGEMLGLHVKKQLKEVMDAGVFPTRDDCLDRRARMVERAAIEGFLGALAEAASRSTFQRGSARVVDWKELRRMGVERKISLAEVLVLLRDGRLLPIAGDGREGIRRFLFLKSDASAALDRVVTDRDGTVSMREVAKTLKVTPRSAYSLVDKGYLPALNGAGGIRVGTDDLTRFRAGRDRRAGYLRHLTTSNPV